MVLINKCVGCGNGPDCAGIPLVYSSAHENIVHCELPDGRIINEIYSQQTTSNWLCPVTTIRNEISNHFTNVLVKTYTIIIVL